MVWSMKLMQRWKMLCWSGKVVLVAYAMQVKEVLGTVLEVLAVAFASVAVLAAQKDCQWQILGRGDKSKTTRKNTDHQLQYLLSHSPLPFRQLTRNHRQLPHQHQH